MMGAFVDSVGGGAPCHLCGKKIRIGHRVFYDGPRMTDDVRTCESCIDFDLFGSVA